MYDSADEQHRVVNLSKVIVLMKKGNNVLHNTRMSLKKNKDILRGVQLISDWPRDHVNT